ncbi:MAG: hypothetical protein AAF594_03950, partial [Bacteroidota bacterium]
MTLRFSLAVALVGLLAVPVGAQSYADAVRAYAWADQQTADSYTPSPAFSYNSSGGDITATRSEEGRYAVTFADLGSIASAGNVQVTAYGSTASCVSNGWGSTSGGLRVNVRCDDADGNPSDARYTVLFVTSADAAVPTMAYAWASQPENASYTPSTAYSYNGAGGAITATRSAAGTYQMQFADLSMSNGNVQVTAYQSDARCTVTGWAGPNINVRCYDPAGALVDSPYTVLFVGNAAATDDIGFAWANNQTSDSYAPSPSYVVNANGDVTATRTAAGTYRMTFDGLGGASSGGNVMVSSYSTVGVQCNVSSWGSSGTFGANVRCYDSDGALADARYTILVSWPARIGVTTEAAPEAAFALAVAPNPAASAATVRWQLDAPAEVRLG